MSLYIQLLDIGHPYRVTIFSYLSSEHVEKVKDIYVCLIALGFIAFILIRIVGIYKYENYI